MKSLKPFLSLIAILFYFLSMVSCSPNRTRLNKLGNKIEHYVGKTYNDYVATGYEKKNNTRIPNGAPIPVFEMNPVTLHHIKGVKGKFSRLIDLKIVNGKIGGNLSAGDITYDMSFKAIVNIAPGFSPNTLPSDDISFWGLKFHITDEAKIGPGNYIHIKGKAHFEEIGDSWELDNYEIKKASYGNETTNKLAGYDMFGKVVKIEQQGTMTDAITIRVEKNNYFHYYVDYVNGKWRKMKIEKSFDFTFTCWVGGAHPTTFIPSLPDFWDLAKKGTMIGVNFRPGFLITEADDHTLVDQRDGGWQKDAVQVDIIGRQ